MKKELEDSGNRTLDDELNNRFIESDLGFHALLMSMANNSRIQRTIDDTRLLIRENFAIRRRGHDAAQLQSIYDYHQKVLDAVAAQEPALAMKAMSEHIQASQRERLSENTMAGVAKPLYVSIIRACSIPLPVQKAMSSDGTYK